MLAFAGMGLLTFTFVLLTRFVLILFSRPYQVLAVAQTVVKEATRSRVSLVFVILLLVLLPLLPIFLDPDTPLRFRVQTFISRSLTLTYVLAACSPTHAIGPEVYHEGWARGGAIKAEANGSGMSLTLKHNGVGEKGGPLFWAHYSYSCVHVLP